MSKRKHHKKAFLLPLHYTIDFDFSLGLLWNISLVCLWKLLVFFNCWEYMDSFTACFTSAVFDIDIETYITTVSVQRKIITRGETKSRTKRHVISMPSCFFFKHTLLIQRFPHTAQAEHRKTNFPDSCQGSSAAI